MNGETHTDAGRLDYSIITSYWKKVKPSIMGPYMMEGFGFPARAGRFRFDADHCFSYPNGGHSIPYVPGSTIYF